MSKKKIVFTDTMIKNLKAEPSKYIGEKETASQYG